MKEAFASEDGRKNKLFAAWNEHLRKIHHGFKDDEFEKTYEGLVEILGLSESYMGVRLHNGKKLPGVPITPEIYAFTLRQDLIYMRLGRRDKRWWPLEVISVGSFLQSTGDQGGFHITFNPRIVDPGPNRGSEALS